MKISDLIYILLFVIPGVMSEKVSYLFEIPNDKKRTDFGDLIHGIALSIPITSITFVIIADIKGFNTLNQLIDSLNDIYILFLVILILFPLIFISGFIIGLLKDPLLKLINYIRTILGKIEIDDKSCWRKLFFENNKSKYIVLEKDGKIYKGITKSFSLPSEEKEVILYCPETWKEYPEIEEKFKDIKQTYINIEKNIVIKDYDMKEYNEYCDKLNHNS